ncbi:MAG: trypsin-like serine protease [bacterium]|nr:trypsin-like serine protease [bacterium]
MSDPNPAREANGTHRVFSNPWVFGGTVFVATTALVLGVLHLTDRVDLSDRGHDDVAALQRPRPVTLRGALTESEQRTMDIYRRASRSVVHVTTERDESLGGPVVGSADRPGSGSGFIWNDRGYIVTNAHVVVGSTRGFVSLSNGTRWEAELVGLATAWDLAVLQIKAPRDHLPAIDVGTSHDLSVGQSVYAIGNPFGLDQTLTSGVVSGLHRHIRSRRGVDILGVIQTDAAINPGNSGGPLLDSSGNLIGINTAIHIESETSMGVGFAVPVEIINNEVPRIIREGFQDWPELGMVLAPDMCSRELLRKSRSEEEDIEFGVVVIEVAIGGPAHQADVRSMSSQGSQRLYIGDVIVGVDGQPVASRDDVDAVIDRKRPGDEIVFDLRRKGERVQACLRLAARGSL